eukprot:gene5581-5553_t
MLHSSYARGNCTPADALDLPTVPPSSPQQAIAKPPLIACPTSTQSHPSYLYIASTNYRASAHPALVSACPRAIQQHRRSGLKDGTISTQSSRDSTPVRQQSPTPNSRGPGYESWRRARIFELTEHMMYSTLQRFKSIKKSLPVYLRSLPCAQADSPDN